MSINGTITSDPWILGHSSNSVDGAKIVSDVGTPAVVSQWANTTASSALTPGAAKYDTGKVRLELLSVPAMEAIAEVMTFGAKKYAAHNWRKGFEWSRLFGATLRHLFAALKGEDRDPESGLPHLAHAGCCIMFLLEHYLCGLGTDDRHITGAQQK